MSKNDSLERLLRRLRTDEGRKNLIAAINGARILSEPELHFLIEAKRDIIDAEVALNMGNYGEARAQYKKALDNLERYGNFNMCYELVDKVAKIFPQGFLGIRETYRRTLKIISPKNGA